MKIFILNLILITVFSCQFTEDIYISEDGSGTMKFSMDASGVFDMMGQMGGGNTENVDGKQSIDSTFTFKELFDGNRDSIAKLSEVEQKKLKSIENFKVHMVMNEAEKKMVFDISTEFKDVSGLTDMFTAISAVGNLKNNGSPKVNDHTNPLSSMAVGGNTELVYSYSKNHFKRSVKVLDKEKQTKQKDSLGPMLMMFGSSKYRVNYHFKKPVKSVSKKDALFSQDKKTVTVEYDFSDYISDPEIMNLEIELED